MCISFSAGVGAGAGAFPFVIILCPSQIAVMRKRVLVMLADMKALDGAMSVMTLGTAGDMNVTCVTHVIRVPVIIATVVIPITAMLAGVGGIITDAIAKTPKNVVEIIIIIIGNKSAIF